MRAFSVIDGCKGAAALLGPALAGVLTASSGALPALSINAVCYAAAIATLLCLPKQVKPREAAGSFSVPAYLREIAEGLSFYRQFPAMLTIMIMASISNLSSYAVWSMEVPYVREVLHRDAAAVGSLSTAPALGYLIGISVISLIGEIKHRRIVMLGSLGGMGIIMALWGLIPSYPFALTAAFGIGALGPFFGSISSSLHGQLVPGNLQGRVNSIRYLIGGCLQPIGAFAGGAVAEFYGLSTLFLAAGLLPAVCAGLAMLLPVLRPLDGDLSTLPAEIHQTSNTTTLVTQAK
ncbi:enterobactin exporter EntS [compost metagenome]